LGEISGLLKRELSFTPVLLGGRLAGELFRDWSQADREGLLEVSLGSSEEKKAERAGLEVEAGSGHHQVGDVALLPPAGLDEEQLGSPVQLADVTHLRDETLDVPGLGSLAALDEVVRGAVADDQEQETAGVFVFVLTGELLLQIVHLFAVQVGVDLHVKPDCLENFGHGGNILLGGRLLPVQVIHYDGRAQSLPV